MKKNYCLLFTVYCLLIFLISHILYLISPAHAQSLKLLPEKDTYVDSNNSDKNFGKNDKFSLGFTHSSKIAFLKFNLDNITKDSMPKKATLNLYLEQSSGELKPIQVEILLPSKDWNEEELNWNNKPSLYKTDLTVTLEATPGAQAVDITPLVKQWLEGSIKNYGLALFQREENFQRTFLSKENEKQQPALTFSWDQENPPVGGPNPNPLNLSNNPKSLEIFSVQEKEATGTATPSAEITENREPRTENRKSPIPNPHNLPNSLINSKNIIILGLGLLALLTVGGEKILKVLKKEKS